MPATRSTPKKVLAFDWDQRTLRVVHAAMGKRGLKVERLLSVKMPADLDPGDPRQLGLHIRRVLEQERITTKHAVADIPRDQAILNTLKLPVTAPDELPGIVEIQIAKELPFALGEAAIDFTIESQRGDGVTADVLVAAVRREVLEQYEATFAAAGLRLDRVGLRPYANKAAVCRLLQHAMPQRVLFLDVRPALTEINVLRDSALVFSRAASVMIHAGDDAPLGGVEDEDAHPQFRVSADAPTEERMAIQAILVEVMRSIEAYRGGDPGATMDHVVIAGDTGVEESLAEALQDRLGITGEIYNPASTFGWEPDEGANASGFAASLGLVLGHADAGQLHLDFLHPKKTVTATQRRLRKAPLVAAVAVLFVAATIVGLLEFTRPKRAALAELERQIAERQAQTSENEKFSELMDEIRAFDAQYVWVDVLYDIITSLPSNQELIIDRVDLNQKDAGVVLKTKAKQRDTALEAVRQLEAFTSAENEEPCFKVVLGAQAEKSAEEYPFAQDLRIRLLRRPAQAEEALRPQSGQGL